MLSLMSPVTSFVSDIEDLGRGKNMNAQAEDASSTPFSGSTIWWFLERSIGCTEPPMRNQLIYIYTAYELSDQLRS